MEHFPYGEDGQVDHLGASLLVAGEPEHLEGVHGTHALQIAGAYTDEAVGIAGGLEYPPRGLELTPVEQLVSLPVQLCLFIPRQPVPWRIGGFYEAFLGEAFERLFIHT